MKTADILDQNTSKRKSSKAFTMLELVFVIVIMGILAKFGAELFRNVYETYISSSIQNRMQADTELALQQIANRLQYRIKDSVIARTDAANFQGLPSAAGNEVILEWIGYDIDGWLGTDRGGTETYNKPTWTGFIDVDAIDTANADNDTLYSPETDTAEADTIIQALRATGSNTAINNTAIVFTGANSNIQDGYGWNGIVQDQNNSTIHPIQQVGNIGVAAEQLRAPGADTFDDVDVYEQYKLSWTAYALSLEDINATTNVGDLYLYYDYQPWEGERYDGNVNGVALNDRRRLLITDVHTFKFQAIGDMIKIQICINDGNILGDGGYSLCKEKAIF